jgi:hypothetical protein
MTDASIGCSTCSTSYHECLAIRVARKLKANVIDILSDLFILHGIPADISLHI